MLLLMSAFVCLFTSCSKDDEEKTVSGGGVTSVELQLAVSSQSFDWMDGSFTITFLPSGRKEEVSANSVLFAIDANPVTDAELLRFIKSGRAKKYTFTTTCDGSEKQIVVKSNIKIKSGVEIKEDAAYDFEVSGILNYRKGLNSGVASRDDTGNPGISGKVLTKYISDISGMELMVFNLR